MVAPSTPAGSTCWMRLRIFDMLQSRLKKHEVAIVLLLHWFDAVTWVLLVATGSRALVAARSAPPGRA